MTPRRPQDKSSTSDASRASGQGAAAAVDSTYSAPFWYAYVGNTCLMLAVSLLYRYADLVTSLGGTEWDLGWIIGVGMVGSLLMRVAQAEGIDRIGARRVWVWSVLAFAVACVAHTFLTTVHGPAVYLLRVAYQTSVAGAFGASITYISMRAPVVRVAEVVGTLGTSGFIGMMGGTLLGDLICGASVVSRAEVNRMFVWAAGLGLLSSVFAWLATRRDIPPARRRRPAAGPLVRRYHPGWLLLVAVAVGIGVGLPSNYLRPYTESLGIKGIAVFFWVYAPTAFLTRLTSRRMPERFGVRPMVFAGLSCMVFSILLYPIVRSEWTLAVPAVFAGVAHAFLFPSVTGGGSTAFPVRYRGLGVTLMLTMVDIGNLVGAPLAGAVLEMAESSKLPAYPAMFFTVAGVLTLFGAGYALFGQRAVRITDRTAPRRKKSKRKRRLRQPSNRWLAGSPPQNPATIFSCWRAVFNLLTRRSANQSRQFLGVEPAQSAWPRGYVAC